MAKKTEIKPEDLKDFELTFYDGMQRFGKTIASTVGGEVKSCIPKRVGGRKTIVELILDTEKSEMPATKLLGMVKKNLTHFIVFYTPAHYRPQPSFKAEKTKYKNEILIIGTYVEE